MGFLSVLSMAHKWIAERTFPGDTVIDATAGGGTDSLTLAQLVGANGSLYVFDIQQEALDRTRERLDGAVQKNQLPRVKLLLDNHARMAEALEPSVHGAVAAIMFNLGYLPGGDETLITQPPSTIAALNAALSLLRPGGIVTCVLYPGHPGGADEAATVEGWAAQLPGVEYTTVLYRRTQRQAAPYLIAVEKKQR
ncbi:MAG: class I SAM-dependent methyltransferase [Candidatus Pristimantibacillus sp.]